MADYAKTIGMLSTTRDGRGFRMPYSLAVSGDGRIFVVNRVQMKVAICTYDEEYLGEFASGPGDGDDQFRAAVSMAFDSQDRLHVTDEQNHRVSVFDSSGGFLTKWGEHGSGAGQLDGPSGIAFDSQDNAYIGDQRNNRVQVFDRDGNHLRHWGERGSGDGQFNLPWGVDVDSEGNVYVADWRNDRVQKFTSDGAFLASLGESGDGEGQFNRPADVAVDERGHIYVADWSNHRVQVLGPDGTFQKMLRGEAKLSQWAQEFLDVNPDEKEPRERSELFATLPSHVKDPYDISSQTEPYFWGPTSVTLDRQGRLYVTECFRHRVQVYQTG